MSGTLCASRYHTSEETRMGWHLAGHAHLNKLEQTSSDLRHEEAIL